MDSFANLEKNPQPRRYTPSGLGIPCSILNRIAYDDVPSHEAVRLE